MPGSKRYPETEAEQAHIDARHLTLLRELGASVPGDTWFVSVPTYRCAGEMEGDAPRAEGWTLRLGPPVKWQSYMPDDYDECVRHLWLYEISRDDPSALLPLLHAVAEDQIRDVLIGPTSWVWLYHPYDGGADVVASDALRHQLMSGHPDWLAPGACGL